MRRAASPSNWLFTPLAGITWGLWQQVLADYGRSIAPRYWPRTAFTTLMAALNSLLRPLEAGHAELDRYEVREPIFIIGHYRSGTTHLWRLLANDPQFVYSTTTEALFPHTLLTFSRIAEQWARWFQPTQRPQDNIRNDPASPLSDEWALCASTLLSTHMGGHFPHHRADFQRFLSLREASEREQREWQQAFDRFARKLLYKRGGTARILSKAPTHTAKVPLILQLYPDARFIHIHRDPYVVFQSTVKMERDAQPFCAYQDTTGEDLEDYVLWRYRRLYEAFFAARAEIPPGQFAEVSYEGLVQDRIGTLKRLYDTLGLPGWTRMKPTLAQYVHQSANYRTNRYEPLSPEQITRINRVWGPIIDHLGYDRQEPEPAGPNGSADAEPTHGSTGLRSARSTDSTPT